MNTLTRAFTLGLLLAIGNNIAHAAPVPEDERLSLDLRRTTLVVRDIDRSLALYNEALGMTISYDKMIRNPRDAKTDETSDISRRLTFLQANDDFIGVLGLLEYRKPRKEQPLASSETAFEPGTIVLVFNVKDLDQRWDSVVATPGVEVISEPTRVEYPSYDGKGVIPVMVSVIRDPDGFVIELNQLLVDKLN
ncbi:VOC family protein [Halioglobus maricola]|uniref:VOC family protein n=1 Tax=Halioglobus maricola TaxID=2601894 RepID=A0A5P9NLB6_9GAMM|nr:VOC family protein [Halioglobus maricola]QFU75728.1 VOC family protein [Halioglobus maricola]